MVDKNSAMIEFLNNCPAIRENPLFFNFINAKDDNKQFLTFANDKTTDRTFIDGSIQKRYTFTIVDFKSVTYNAVVMQPGFPNENVEEFLEVQDIIDWITEQDSEGNYPDFGSDCTIDSMRALTDNPNLNGIDSSVNPTLAKYSVSIQIEYIDFSKSNWR